MSVRVDLGGRRIIKKIFFKQKTAYEILRSDWSSDVCSSDPTALWINSYPVSGLFDSFHVDILASPKREASQSHVNGTSCVFLYRAT